MPVYEYLNTATGLHVDMIKSVAERDDVPGHLKRVTVPRRVAISGTSSSPIDPHSAESQVPRAFRQLEERMPAREIVKEGGFSIDAVKQIWAM